MKQANPDHFRRRANEIFEYAAQVTDPESRADLIRLAVSYHEAALKLDAMTRPLGQWDLTFIPAEKGN